MTMMPTVTSDDPAHADPKSRPVWTRVRVLQQHEDGIQYKKKKTTPVDQHGGFLPARVFGVSGSGATQAHSLRHLSISSAI